MDYEMTKNYQNGNKSLETIQTEGSDHEDDYIMVIWFCSLLHILKIKIPKEVLLHILIKLDTNHFHHITKLPGVNLIQYKPFSDPHYTRA
jgi:hypothetical protein